MDDAEILLPDCDNLVAQAELFTSGYIEFDKNSYHITQKGYAAVWDYLRKLSPSKRLLFYLFFDNSDAID